MNAPAAAQAPPTASGKRWRLYTLGLLVAAGLAWWTWSLLQDHWRISATGIQVEGTMTGSYRQVQSTRSGTVTGTTYNPTFSYRTPQGNVVLGTVQDSVDRAEIERGRRMALIHDPQDPFSVRLASGLAAGPGLAPWVIGILALVVGIPSLIGLMRRRTS